jgi:hypothetical protein
MYNSFILCCVNRTYLGLLYLETKPREACKKLFCLHNYKIPEEPEVNKEK